MSKVALTEKSVKWIEGQTSCYSSQPQEACRTTYTVNKKTATRIRELLCVEPEAKVRVRHFLEHNCCGDPFDVVVLTAGEQRRELPVRGYLYENKDVAAVVEQWLSDFNS